MFWTIFCALCEHNRTKPILVIKELNISTGNITKWKNGRIPKTDALFKISNYFSVSIDYLLGQSEAAAYQLNTGSNNMLHPENDINAQYLRLDEEDKAKIKEEIKQMLKSPKYTFPALPSL